MTTDVVMRRPVRKVVTRGERTPESFFCEAVLQLVVESIEPAIQRVLVRLGTPGKRYRFDIGPVGANGANGAEIVLREQKDYWQHRASIVLPGLNNPIQVAVYSQLAPEVERLVHPSRVQMLVDLARDELRMRVCPKTKETCDE